MAKQVLFPIDKFLASVIKDLSEKQNMTTDAFIELAISNLYFDIVHKVTTIPGTHNISIDESAPKENVD